MTALQDVPQGLDLEGLLDSLVDGVVLVDRAGHIRHANAEACRILEISPDAGPYRSFSALLGHAHPLAKLAEEVLDTRRPALQDGLPVQRRHGETLELSVSLSPLDLDVADVSLVVIMRDRTTLNDLRERFTHEERLASYGQIAAGIAHEVKNPLGGIRGAAELLGLWARGDERAQRTAEMIVREVDRITGLVEELMVFARGDRLDLGPVNVHQLIDEVIQNVELDGAAHEIQFDRTYDPSIPEIEADRARLTQVLLNLVRNAVQAMEDGDEGGRLEIRTRMPLEHRLTGLNGRAIATVQISLSDNGPGIEWDVLARLATPFFTTKAKGTGLGLAVSRHWINLHGGRLRIESQPGKGTTVHVELPLRAQVRSEDTPPIDEPDIGSPRSRHHGV
jgi:two-component system nitrogen regulation sensor histidine kinase GlnL